MILISNVIVLSLVEYCVIIQCNIRLLLPIQTTVGILHNSNFTEIKVIASCPAIFLCYRLCNRVRYICNISGLT